MRLMMRSLMAITLLVLALFCVTLGTHPHTVLAASPKWLHEIHQTFDNADYPLWIECANGGAGELFHIFGDVHTFIQARVDKDGVMHIQSHTTTQGASAQGLTTGNLYRFIGIELDKNYDLPPSGDAFCFHDDWVYTLNFIGKGKMPNITVHQTIRVDLCIGYDPVLDRYYVFSESYHVLNDWAKCR
ncbi:MAG TPA: hypothetical protein PLN61_01735 [bacterium]|nr:hypothetical protein [bacterium]HQI47358.1 hypothetical protein [bacterium]HQJ63040.1 hypothetical protein [bacterium]